MLYYDLVKLSEKMYKENLENKDDFIKFLVENEKNKYSADKEEFILIIYFDLISNSFQTDIKPLSKEIFDEYVITPTIKANKLKILTTDIKDNVIKNMGVYGNKDKANNLLENLLKDILKIDIKDNNHDENYIVKHNKEYDLIVSANELFKTKIKDFETICEQFKKDNRIRYISLAIKYKNENEEECVITKTEIFKNKLFEQYQSEKKSKDEKCYLCGSKDAVSADYTKNFIELKYFITDNKFFAEATDGDFKNKFSFCKSCYNKLLVLDKRIRNFVVFRDISRDATLEILVYPKIFKMEDDNIDISDLVDRIKDSFFSYKESKSFANWNRKIQDNYVLNFQFVLNSNAQRKIISTLRDIRPTRLLEVFKVLNDYQIKNNNFRLLKIKDIFNISKSDNVSKRTNVLNNYLDFLNVLVKQDKSYNIIVLYSHMVKNIILKNVKKQSWYYDINLYADIINFIREEKINIDNIYRGGTNMKLFEEISNSQSKDLQIIKEFVEKKNLTTDDEIMCIAIGYLAGNVGRKQSGKYKIYHTISSNIRKDQLPQLVNKIIIKGKQLDSNFNFYNKELITLIGGLKNINIASEYVTFLFFLGISLNQAQAFTKDNNKEAINKENTNEEE